jgi:DNA repair protein RadC
MNTNQVSTTNTTTPALLCSELPQARFDHLGTAGLSDIELIALVLSNGMPVDQLMTLSRKLLIEAGSLRGVMSCSPEELKRIKGIGPARARQFAALIEINRRMMQPDEAQPLLCRADLVAAHMAGFVADLEIEKFWVACLNRKNRLKKLVEITSGTATTSLAHPREVFRAAIRYGATAVICIHNHPSGDPTPSTADLHVTRQLREAAKAVDIDLIDHVIIGRKNADPTGNGHYSFRAAGLL